jgi:hypothetical protein
MQYGYYRAYTLILGLGLKRIWRTYIFYIYVQRQQALKGHHWINTKELVDELRLFTLWQRPPHNFSAGKLKIMWGSMQIDAYAYYFFIIIPAHPL